MVTPVHMTFGSLFPGNLLCIPFQDFLYLSALTFLILLSDTLQMTYFTPICCAYMCIPYRRHIQRKQNYVFSPTSFIVLNSAPVTIGHTKKCSEYLLCE